MAQAARQYYGYNSYAGSAARAVQPAPQAQPDVVVIPGRRSSNPALQSISPQLASAFKLMLVALVVLAALCVTRIYLSTATVSLLNNVDSLETTLATSLTKTNELEIQHSVLAGTTRIEQEASGLGMSAPSNVKYIKVVVPGKVALNSNGTISLAGTLQNIEAYYAPKTE